MFLFLTVPAKIASFDDTYTTIYKEDMTLPCLAVGIPPPEITWKIKGVAFTTSDRIRQQPDGSLLIRDITRTDAGEYSCHVENSFGQDSVTHQLIVNSPPHSPVVRANLSKPRLKNYVNCLPCYRSLYRPPPPTRSRSN